jgi:hypothetical protein
VWGAVPSVLLGMGSIVSRTECSWVQLDSRYMLKIMTLRKYDLPSTSQDKKIIITLWPRSANELYRPSDRSLSAKLVSTFANRGV